MSVRHCPKCGALRLVPGAAERALEAAIADVRRLQHELNLLRHEHNLLRAELAQREPGAAVDIDIERRTP